MTNLQQSIEQQVTIFANNVSQLVRQAAISALEQALNVSAAPVPMKAGKGQRGRRAGGAGRAGKSRAMRKPASVRDSAELAALTEKLYTAVAAQPGETMEVLASVVGCPARELRVSIGHLCSQGRVKKAGQRRATRYFPMGGDRQ
jgi:hypothetical protein